MQVSGKEFSSAIKVSFIVVGWLEILMVSRPKHEFLGGFRDDFGIFC